MGQLREIEIITLPGVDRERENRDLWKICKTQQKNTSTITAPTVPVRVDVRDYRLRTGQAQGTTYRRQSAGLLPLSTGIRDSEEIAVNRQRKDAGVAHPHPSITSRSARIEPSWFIPRATASGSGGST